LTGLAVVLSYLSRETGLFLLPLFWVFLRRKFSREHVRLALPAVIYLLVESFVAYHTTGDFFHHYHAAQADCAQQALIGLNQHGFFTYLGAVFGGNLYGLSHFGFFYFVFAAALVFFARTGRLREIGFPLVWFLVFASYYQFGVVGFSPFLPVPKMFRYLCILTFPVLLMSSAFLTSPDVRQKSRGTAPGILLFLFLTSLTGTFLASRKHRAYFSLEGGPAKYGSFAEAIERRSPEIVGVPNLSWKYRMKYFLARRGEETGRIPVVVVRIPADLSGRDGVLLVTNTPSPANDFSFCKIILRHQQDLLLDCDTTQDPT